MDVPLAFVLCEETAYWFFSQHVLKDIFLV